MSRSVVGYALYANVDPWYHRWSASGLVRPGSLERQILLSKPGQAGTRCTGGSKIRFGPPRLPESTICWLGEAGLLDQFVNLKVLIQIVDGINDP